MSVERTILIVIWGITIIGLIYLVPRKRLREAWLIFLFKQVITWIFGLLVAEYGLVEYPIREFPNASQTSFSFEYFIYPAICIVFNLRFPEKKGWIRKALWYLFFPTWMTVIEVILERYTDLIEFVNWSWFWTWITLLITFILSRIYYLWFFRKFKKIGS